MDLSIPLRNARWWIALPILGPIYLVTAVVLIAYFVAAAANHVMTGIFEIGTPPALDRLFQWVKAGNQPPNAEFRGLGPSE